MNRAAQHARPISDALLTWLQAGAGKTQQAAYEHWKTLDEKVPKEEQQLTRKMQHYLFLEIYAEYEAKTKELTTKADVCEHYLDGNKIDWDALPENVKEVLIDLTYRGDYTGSEDKRGNTRKVIIPAVYKDQKGDLSGYESDFYQVMTDNNLWRVNFKVDPNRVKKRYKELE